MTSTSRSLLALFCGLALMIGTSPVRSAIFADTAPLGSPPVTVTNSTPFLLVFDFGQSFASVSSVQLSLTFAGDLWDPGEGWFVDGYGGQQNVTGVSKSSTQLNINAGGNPLLFADLLDGKFSANINADLWAPGTMFGLAGAQLLVDAMPASVVEPASLGLFAAGIASFAAARRHRNRGRIAAP
jgi:hypothetical protein